MQNVRRRDILKELEWVGPSRPTDYERLTPYSSSEAQLSFAAREAVHPCLLNYLAVYRKSKTASPYPAPPVYQNWRHKPELYFVTQIREWRGGRSWRVGEEGDSANLPSLLSHLRSKCAGQPPRGNQNKQFKQNKPAVKRKEKQKSRKAKPPAVNEKKKEKRHTAEQIHCMPRVQT